MAKFKFKHDAVASKVLTTVLEASKQGFAQIRSSLIDDNGISGGIGIVDGENGDEDDKVDELDDTGDSLPYPLFSPGVHSRSSSRIPSRTESSVNGIILRLEFLRIILAQTMMEEIIGLLIAV